MSYNLSVKAKRAYQTRSLLNLLRMGHCAPTVMQTMLQLTHNEQVWLVRLTAGLPGGIGNTQGECGGLTAPLIILGLRHGLDEMHADLPTLFDYGYDYSQRFANKNAALSCKEIQGRCVQAVCYAPTLLAETLTGDHCCAIPDEQRAAFAHLYTHLLEQDFHCAQAVFSQLGDIIPVNQELQTAVSAFLGGTLFQGMTCSAFTAGVMAIGLQTGEIENSYSRVVRMLVKGMDISDEDANKFHRTINAGQRLSEWFIAEFGSTQCRIITQCDFSCASDVERYITHNGVSACQKIAASTAKQVQNIIAETHPIGEII
jgi:hypothetical protein